jgi:translation initiation factor IF-2
MRQRKHFRDKKITTTKTEGLAPHSLTSADKGQEKKLEIVLKSDSAGSQEAVISSIATKQDPRVAIQVIHAGLGPVSKSDLLMARTGSRIVVGFNVGISPMIKQLSQEQQIEVRLYDVIYKLTDDLHKIANSLIPRGVEEKITGKAKVIALFKISRKGVILGCEVLEGTLALGKDFRVISAMGAVYTGKIQSLHIEKDSVKQAKTGQQVGLKIPDFKKAKLGDLVECYEIVPPKAGPPWQPRGDVFHG